MAKVSFYCRRCELDQDLEAELVETSIAKFFRARCVNCREKLVRQMDSLVSDPYFRYSRKLRRQRDEYRIDLIQPNQEGFRMYYPKVYEEEQKKLAAAEAKARTEKAERDAFYKKFWYNINDRQVARAAFNAEEKLRGK